MWLKQAKLGEAKNYRDYGLLMTRVKWHLPMNLTFVLWQKTIEKNSYGG